MKMRKTIGLSLMLLCLIGLISGCGTREALATAAEKYPDKPLTLIVPFAPGGASDMIARALGESAYKHLGQNVIIKNVLGAGGILGWNELVESKDDGYTLGMVDNSALLQPLYEAAGYHYPSALDPLVQIIDLPVIAVVRSDSPWNSLSELVDYAKQHPHAVKFGHSGLGNGTHLIGEMVAQNTGITLDQVPFKGTSESLAALLGGHIQLMFAVAPRMQEHVKSGTVKVIGVAATKRINDPLYSNVPTFREQGADVIFSFFWGVGAHKGLPPEIKAKLLAGLEKTVNDPEYIENMRKLGMEVNYLGHEDFVQKWLNETRKLTKVVKGSGIAEKIAEQKK
ncbi:Tripartite-type tricarboxylate transporter, receptor component TctC [Dendrosporobacter quercicolus]|uniref:Tripartite-type tricarboxylate transporter, receptor component TctC n=2 Tax=Dendrosporobacter quercicolus TaxID=146817 RepID=A0A1G9QK35_9FIRM|nr:Tripartite-type tricarboxylate transporter, receptor component TctC [Dendrosporobacter quercicolus]